MDADPTTPRRSPDPRVRVAVCDERGRPIRTGLSRWLENIAPARARGAAVALRQHAGQTDGGEDQGDDEADYPETPGATQPSTAPCRPSR